MKNSISLFDCLMKTQGGVSKLNQIVFIISDGRFNKNVIIYSHKIRKLDLFQLKRKIKDYFTFL